MIRNDLWTGECHIVPAPRRTDDLGVALRSVFGKPSRLPDAWIKLIARLDGFTAGCANNGRV
ncbi:hypothetical protein RN629_04660 [Sphingomonadaceae bacterium jetA1]|jgi:hypothetical protein|uniref:hypothetical protein n=1 Tax=Facivitalis istanbulensis TaxID=3075838 RepID=UPI0034703E61